MTPRIGTRVRFKDAYLQVVRCRMAPAVLADGSGPPAQEED